MPPSRWIDSIRAQELPPFIGQPGIACANPASSPDDFFPGRGDPVPAQTICRSCDHTAACLEFALRTDQRFGVWGGATPGQRIRIRKNRGDR
ncbi:MAG TPA: WhiB family transcriptional regulator [Actinoplanes sp.]|jgi:hypothetical protein